MAINIGHRARELREHRNLSQKNIAGFLGVDQSYISKLETGERPMQADVLEKLAILYGCRTSDFTCEGLPARPGMNTAFRANELSEKDLETIFVINRIALNSFEMTKMLEKNARGR